MSNTDIKDELIISRILGHPEIADSDRWMVSRNCYICERWKYTIFYAKVNPNEEKQTLFTRLANAIAQHKNEFKICGSFDSFMNSRTHLMKNLMSFVEIIDPNYQE